MEEKRKGKVSAKIIVARCMCMVLIALIAVALFSEISISQQLFVIGASIYGFFEIHKWTKK